MTKLDKLLKPSNIEHSVLFGYYGGGNYGDELLLEVLLNLLKKQQVRHITIAYNNPANYGTYHHDFGYSIIDMRSKVQLIRAILRNKNVVVGGGGLWGLDFNNNVLLFSLLLFASRWLLGNKVYLLGIGYYGSTNRIGHVGAWLAAKAANIIIARDVETRNRFRTHNRHTYIDRDIVWLTHELDLNAYQASAERLEEQLSVAGKTLLIALRRFRPRHHNNFAGMVEELVRRNHGKSIILVALEPEYIDPANNRLIRSLERYANVQSLTKPCNPLALYLFFQRHSKKLALIAPQFHAILTAHLNAVPFLPVSYDNKVSQLLKQIGTIKPIPIQQLTIEHLQAFVDNFYGATA